MTTKMLNLAENVVKMVHNKKLIEKTGFLGIRTKLLVHVLVNVYVCQVPEDAPGVEALILIIKFTHNFPT